MAYLEKWHLALVSSRPTFHYAEIFSLMGIFLEALIKPQEQGTVTELGYQHIISPFKKLDLESA